MNPLQRFWQQIRFALTGRFLCDTCRYDYGDACRRPARPNAKTCPEYRRNPGR